ncbi:MAG: hypothetical protein J0I20_26070 [Chloroflexi bacterium]|nr:hypothetical protein [Chloroflexota bacterium]OJW06479.1 MAG: hypothetical protein BGO39_00230 [Chloroflexi bacterium 54-19]
MKSTEANGSPVASKQELCQQIQKLQSEVNDLALRVSGCNGNEYHVIWSNLANARAYLATALEASQHLKEQHLPTLFPER